MKNNKSVLRVILLINSLEFKNDIISNNGNIYAVGGIVRDAFMGKESDDLDIVVQGIPFDNLITILSKYGRAVDTSNIDKDSNSFGAIKFKSNDKEFNDLLDGNNILNHDIDIMLPRKDIKDPSIKGHRGIKSDVNYSYTIYDDLDRRDITINALAISLMGEVIDKDNRGINDINNKVIRAVSNESFIEDPLRMLRVIRFSARFNYPIDTNTKQLIVGNSKLLSDKKELPSERFMGEFKKMLGKSDLSTAVKLLVDLNLYEPILGVESKIIDFNIFNYVPNIGELAFKLFDGQDFNIIKDLVKTNISNEAYILDYIDGLIYFISNKKDKSSIAKVFKLSPDVILSSNYVSSDHKHIGKLMLNGKIPVTVNDLLFKGDEFVSFITDIFIVSNGSFNKSDMLAMSRAKKLALDAIWLDELENNSELIRDYLKENKNKWI